MIHLGLDICFDEHKHHNSLLGGGVAGGGHQILRSLENLTTTTIFLKFSPSNLTLIFIFILEKVTTKGDKLKR